MVIRGDYLFLASGLPHEANRFIWVGIVPVGMPQQRFEVTVVARENPESKAMAIANCSKYLAYGDQTDTFGYHAAIKDVDFRRNHRKGDAHRVIFTFETPITHDTELKAFMDEMATLSRVESVEMPATA